MSKRYHTVVVRFGEHFAPSMGTVVAHQSVIAELGYVWWGILGKPLSQSRIRSIQRQRDDGTMSVFFLLGRQLTLAEVETCTQTLIPI